MWITRDREGYGGLKVWLKKPTRGNLSWKVDVRTDMYNSFTLPPERFPEVTWESEPLEVDLIPV